MNIDHVFEMRPSEPNDSSVDVVSTVLPRSERPHPLVYTTTWSEDGRRPATESRDAYVAIKRVLESSLIALAVPLWLPIFLAVWLTVRLIDGAPVLFVQQRVGRGGVPFRMYKFRTMRADAERDGAAFACTNDARITRLGRFLRRTRLDEVPQLFNVLRGDMSLVGPRPEQECFVATFERSIPGYALRHRVRPGLTGLAQVKQGYVADEEGTAIKLRHDLDYVSRVSPKLDAMILLRTVVVVLTGWGAR